jgi:hypothetical protein
MHFCMVVITSLGFKFMPVNFFLFFLLYFFGIYIYKMTLNFFVFFLV